MNQLVVSNQDSRMFFEKVMDHVISHNLLTTAERAKLAEDCNDIHPDICSLFGFNTFDIGQTLTAAKLVQQMLSVKLESLSGGNIAIASQVLQKQSVNSLLIELVQEVRKELRRCVTLAKTARKVGTAFGYNVVIFKGRPQIGAHSKLLSYTGNASCLLDADCGDLFETRECLANIMQSITSVSVLQNIKQDVADMEQEMAVSKKFLPWDILEQEAQLQQTIVNSETFVWTAETFVATLCAILVTGGSNRRFYTDTYPRSWGVAYPQYLLDFLSSRLTNFDFFYQDAWKAFRLFIGYYNQTNPTPTEWLALKNIFEAAMQSLSPESMPKTGKVGLAYWMEKIHVASNPDEFRVFHKKAYRQRHTPVSVAERFLRALENNPNPSSLKKKLINLNWEEAEKEGLADEILSRTDAAILMPHLPLLPEMINRVLSVWETPNGKTVWPHKERLQLVKRALEGGSDLFWKGLDRWALEKLAEVDTQLQAQVEERYSIAFARTK